MDTHFFVQNHYNIIYLGPGPTIFIYIIKLIWTFHFLLVDFSFRMQKSPRPFTLLWWTFHLGCEKVLDLSVYSGGPSFKMLKIPGSLTFFLQTFLKGCKRVLDLSLSSGGPFIQDAKKDQGLTLNFLGPFIQDAKCITSHS